MKKKESLTRWELEQLSTSALEQLLRLDFTADPETEELDPDTIFEILEVLSSRKEPLPAADTEAAWEALMTRIASEGESEPQEVPKEEEPAAPAGKRRKTLRWIAAVAALLCAFIIPASATGALQSIGKWTEETFSFYPWGNEVRGLSNESYEELYNAVRSVTELPVLPKYFPEGSVLEDVSVSRASWGADVDAIITLGEGNYMYAVRLVNDFNTFSSHYQRDDNYWEEYYVDGIPHVIMSNYEEYTVAWRTENLECVISGDIPLDDLKAMIDSMYS